MKVARAIMQCHWQKSYKIDLQNKLVIQGLIFLFAVVPSL